MRFHAKQLSEHLGGQLIGNDVLAEGVSIDSRNVAPGELFVPLVAERDGHDFIEAALEAGAVAYLTSQPPSDDAVGRATAAAIKVDDTTEALTEIGRVARARIDAPVVGITGSVGKTSVKDLTAAACTSTLAVHASEKSFNNELGVPLTIANAPDEVDALVLEMGARGVGHIATLCEIGRPTIGVVTTVALAHSELFGTIEGVAAAKGELIEALPADGIAVLNADNPHVAAMASRASCDVVTFGVDGGDVRATNVQVDELLRPSFVLVTPSGSVEVKLDVRGAHMASNAAAATAAALAVGVDLADAAAGLSAAALSPWRMEVTKAPNGLTVINDAYNANPTSMRAALRSLAELPVTVRVAVVGAMAELGDEGAAEHLAVAAEARADGIRVIAVDAPAYGDHVEHVVDRQAAADAVGSLGVDAAVLVKGSRVAGLEHLAAALLGA
ncbi:MAG: UDP-N-acetylmuramoyl-tripeptide--D-alanyl-D-alanine ligase [Acidimicrobiales bacterium]